MGGNCTSVFVFPLNGTAVYIRDHKKLSNKSISPIKSQKKRKKTHLRALTYPQTRLYGDPLLRTLSMAPSVPLLTGFDCTKSDVLAVMQNIYSGKYKNYYWITVQSQKA